MDTNELPPEVLAALASASGVGSDSMQMPDASQHIDLTTIDDEVQLPSNIALLNAGNSADKPIELDLDAGYVSLRT